MPVTETSPESADTTTMTGPGPSSTAEPFGPDAAFEEVSRLPAGPADFAPVCVPYDGRMTGEAVEYETGTGGLVVLSGSGSAEDIAALEAAWADVSSCSDDTLTFEPWAAPAGAVGFAAVPTGGHGSGGSQHAALKTSAGTVTVVAATGPNSEADASAFLADQRWTAAQDR